MKRKNCIAGTKVIVKDYKGEPSMFGWKAYNLVGKKFTIQIDDGTDDAGIVLEDDDGCWVGYAYPEWLKLADKKDAK